MSNTFYEILYKVKKLDDQIKILESKKSKNPSFILDLREILKQKKADLIEKETLLKLESDKLKTIEGVLSDSAEKQKHSEEKVAKVTNSKEFQAINKELDAVKKSLKNFEAQKEKQIAIIKGITDTVNNLKSSVEKISVDYEASLINFKDENNLIERDLKDLINDKNDLLKDFPKEVLDSYNKVYSRKRNSVVALVKDTRCTGCNMMLPPQLCNDIVKGKDVMFCPSCQRLIIYIENK